MTANDFYKFLEGVDSPGYINNFLAFGGLQVGKQDAMAAKLMLWLLDTMPEDTTVGELHNVLDAAKWWSTLFASVKKDGDA